MTLLNVTNYVTLQVIEWLAGEGGNLNTIGRYGRTPLYRAAFGGHVAAVQILLQVLATGVIIATLTVFT